MVSRYRASLGGVQLDSLDDNLLILDVGYSPLEKQTRQAVVANLDGYDITHTYFPKRTITITFELHIYDIAERNAVCQKVNNWAENGGNLRINDRDGQYIKVECEQFADIASARNWTDPLTLVFTSTNNPFWRSEDQTTVTLNGKQASGTLKLDGNTGSALVGVEITAKATISSLQVNVGSTTLSLKGLSVANGKKIIIDYVSGRFLRIKADGSSVMAKLEPDSSDNLKAKCGANTSVSFTANNSVTAVFTARGLWL